MNDVCHITRDAYNRAGLVVWRLGRPVCGAVDAPRCAPEEDVRVPAGTDHCPRCGRPWCPRCRAQTDQRTAAETVGRMEAN